MLRIALDAGHGYNTAGKRVPLALGHGDIREWELNNKVTLKQIELLNEYEGVEVLRLDDPTGKKDIPLKERTDKANKFKAHVLISNHHNAFKGVPWDGGGLSLHRYPGSTKFTKAMQQALYNSLIKNGAVKGNRASPLSENNFHMVRESNMAAILIEHAFMDSRTDIKEIVKVDFAEKNARGTVEWLAAHYKLKKKPKPEPPKPAIKTDGFYRVVVGSYQDKANAEAQQKKLKEKGFDSFLAYYEK